MLEKIRELVNPYDFANPVSEERSFYGRSSEIADVIYYLNHAKGTDKPIHLALVGARASGKTSFLNIAEFEAKRREFCPVRINLNEGDVQSDLQFFRKFLSAILMAAFNAGAYGGRKSPTFFAYLELTATGEVTDLEQMPFVSAIVIEKALKSGNSKMNVPDDLLLDDLKQIRAELGKPFILLIDECNVLRENRIILEKIRNIFMNLSGFMLMLAATDDFFPIMDEIFSPIMRQFKRIDIGPFKGDGDVKECVHRPLEKAGLSEPEVRSLAQTAFLKEIDALSGRRPYEIQLICHELFKQCQQSKIRRFSLNLSTLEAIQKVIASGQNINDRPLLGAAKRMKSNFFSVLEAVCGGTENLSLSDTWRVEYLFNGTDRWTEKNYFEFALELKRLGFISIADNSVNFQGDHFDRIYIKYLAKSKGNLVSLSGDTIEDCFFKRFAEFTFKHDGLLPMGGVLGDEASIDVSPLISLIENKKVDSLDALNPLLEGILVHVMSRETGNSFSLYELRFKGDLGSGQAWFIWEEPDHKAGVKKLNKSFTNLAERGEQIGVSIEVLSWDLPVISPAEIADRIAIVGDEHLSTRIANELMEMVTLKYVRRKDKAGALEMAKAAFDLQKSRLHPSANNVGYLYLDRGDYSEARLWLQAALQYDEKNEKQLSYYNSGVLFALEGNYRSALFDLERARSERDTDAACVHRLSVGESGQLNHYEEMSPVSLLPLIEEAVGVIQQIK